MLISLTLPIPMMNELNGDCKSLIAVAMQSIIHGTSHEAEFSSLEYEVKKMKPTKRRAARTTSERTTYHLTQKCNREASLDL